VHAAYLAVCQSRNPHAACTSFMPGLLSSVQARTASPSMRPGRRCSGGSWTASGSSAGLAATARLRSSSIRMQLPSARCAWCAGGGMTRSMLCGCSGSMASQELWTWLVASRHGRMMRMSSSPSTELYNQDVLPDTSLACS
jgi:hypothetical protein